MGIRKPVNAVKEEETVESGRTSKHRIDCKFNFFFFNSQYKFFFWSHATWVRCHIYVEVEG